MCLHLYSGVKSTPSSGAWKPMFPRRSRPEELALAICDHAIPVRSSHFPSISFSTAPCCACRCANWARPSSAISSAFVPTSAAACLTCTSHSLKSAATLFSRLRPTPSTCAPMNASTALSPAPPPPGPPRASWAAAHRPRSSRLVFRAP